MNEIQRLMHLPEIIKEYKLEHFIELLAKLGDPQDSLRCVHIAGTNGKGSTSAMIAQGLQEAGNRTGLYTSPYLDRITERIQIDRTDIPKEDLERLLKQVREVSEKHRIPTTFFEFLTAAAYLYFKEQDVDYVVLETGMGGRLDCTNVVVPVVSVITNISMDHSAWLGDTIEKIAAEKAGIVKENVPVFTLATDGLDVIERVAKNNNSKLYIPEQERFELSLKGEFQQENARLAAAVLRKLGIDEAIIKKALKETKWAGRFDFVKPNVLTDVAHNPAAFDVLVTELKKNNYKKIVLVLGIMRDKEIKKMCQIIKPIADEVIITQPKWDRAAAPEEIAEFFDNPTIIPDVEQAVTDAMKRAGEKDLILITGSIFTVSEARKALSLD